MTKKRNVPRPRAEPKESEINAKMASAETIMCEDRAILQALANDASSDGQMTAARKVMKHRRGALRKLAN